MKQLIRSEINFRLIMNLPSKFFCTKCKISFILIPDFDKKPSFYKKVYDKYYKTNEGIHALILQKLTVCKSKFLLLSACEIFKEIFCGSECFILFIRNFFQSFKKGLRLLEKMPGLI